MKRCVPFPIKYGGYIIMGAEDDVMYPIGVKQNMVGDMKRNFRIS